MIREEGGRLVAERAEVEALLAERRAQLARLEAELTAVGEADHPKHDRLLRTAHWSVRVLEQRLKESTQ